MTIARWTLALVLSVAVGGGVVRADVSLFALQEVGDPFRLTSARIEFPDTQRAVIAVNFENRTAQPVSTRQIFLSASRFLTTSEAEGANRLVTTCGVTGHVDEAGRTPQIVAPGASATVHLSIDLTVDCQRDPLHEHFYVYVDRVSVNLEGRYTQPAWQRTAEDFARLLEAALPHP